MSLTSASGTPTTREPPRGTRSGGRRSTSDEPWRTDSRRYSPALPPRSTVEKPGAIVAGSVASVSRLSRMVSTTAPDAVRICATVFGRNPEGAYVAARPAAARRGRVAVVGTVAAHLRQLRRRELAVDPVDQEGAERRVRGPARQEERDRHHREGDEHEADAERHLYARPQSQRVAEAAHGVDQRLAGGVDLLAQVADVGLHDVRVAAEVVVPDVVQDLRLAQHPAGVGEQVAQQPELGGRELHELAGAPHLAALLVQLQVLVDQAPPGVLLAAGAAQHRAHAGHQLLEAERLDHVVVGPDREAAHAVVGVAPGGQEHDRHAGRRGAGEAPVQLEAVHVGEHHVQQHEVGPHRRRGRQRLAPAGRRRGLEALVAQRGAQQLRDALLVIDHQDAGIGRRRRSLLHTRAVRSAAHRRRLPPLTRDRSRVDPVPESRL